MTGPRVAVISSVHRWNDTRIYLKQSQSLARAGYAVSLIAVDDGQQMRVDVGFEIIRLPKRIRYLRWINWFEIVWQVIRLRAAIVHAHDPELFPLVWLLRLTGRRAICDVHENLAEQVRHKEWLPPWIRPAIARVARSLYWNLPTMVDAVILAEDSYKPLFPARPNVRVVRNFPFLPIEFKDDYETKFLRLVYVGDVRIVRGIRTYVEIVRRLLRRGVPVELRVIGSFASATEEQTIRSEVLEHGLAEAIIWCGRRPPEEVPKLLADCDIGLSLLHSIGNYRESYPTKMFEYMAAGLPVIASNFPLWERVLLQSNCGAVVEPTDVDAAADTIHSYWSSTSLRERLGRNGRQAVAERYQWDIERRVLLDTYESLRE